MRYILKYHLFEAISPQETYRRRTEISNLLKNSNAMRNILALYPENRPLYELDKKGDIIFGVGMNPPMGKIKIEYLSYGHWGIKSRAIDKTFNDLEECLRYFWAYVISINIRYFRNRKEMIKILYDDQKYWNTRLSFDEIFKKEVPDSAMNVDTVSEIVKIDKLIEPLGFFIRHNTDIKQKCYICRLDMYKDTNELSFFRIITDIIKIYDDSFHKIELNSINDGFKIKTKDVECEFLKFFKSFKWLRIISKSGNIEYLHTSSSVYIFFTSAYKIYLDSAFKGEEFDNSNLYPLIMKLFNGSLTIPLIGYIHKNIPELYDIFKEKDTKNIEKGKELSDIGFGDD